jgi:thioredoxin-like negative regulator of GroEL
MKNSPECSLIYFYSNYNRESIKTREAINKSLEKYYRQIKITFNDVNYDIETSRIQYFDISGTPTLLILINGEIVGRYYGELTSSEIETIFASIIDKLK